MYAHDGRADYSTEDGAKLLSDMLAAWWRDRHPFGHLAKFWTEPMSGTPYVCVRSNLVKGLPPQPEGQMGVVFPRRFRIGL